MNKYMIIAFNEAIKAYKEDEVPVGAVIVKNNKIIAKAHNKKSKRNCAIYHAEILAIKQACKKLKNWRLNECEMYVTLEPCMMCTGAIVQSRIFKITYLSDNLNYGYLSKINNKNLIIKKECNDSEYNDLLSSFFKSKRN